MTADRETPPTTAPTTPAPLTAAALTQTEAAARSALLSVRSYRIDLDLVGLERGRAFGSSTRITFACARPGEDTWVDLVAEEVTSIQLNGAALDPATHVAGDRIRLPDLRAENTLVVRALHEESGRNYGLRRSVDAADGLAYVWSHCEPQHARRIFACFDQPDLKAPIELTVLAPQAWTCIAGGEVSEVVGGGVTGGSDTAARWTFSPTPPMSTYLFAVCAGPFRKRSLIREGEPELHVYARQSLSEVLDEQAPAILDLTSRALRYFARAYGQPYPMGTLDQVFIPDFPSAMENFGCITYGDATFLPADPTPAQLLLQGRAQLHEIAHLWFGDLVTMPWWDGLWLKEAFATLGGSMAGTELIPGADGWTIFAHGTKPIAYAADRSPISHPIQQQIPDLAAAETAFDAITYDKGLAALRQLLARIGEEAFIAGMRGYFAAHAFGTADLDDLLAALGEAAGEDLHAWADGWIRQAGFDTLAVVEADTDTDGHAGGDGGAGASGDAVLVAATGPAGSTRSHRVAIGHYRRPDAAVTAAAPTGSTGAAASTGATGADLQLLGRHEIDISVGEQVRVELQPREPGDLVLLNDADLTFASVLLDPASRRSLIEVGHLLPTPIARAAGSLILADRLAEDDVAASDALTLTLGLLRREQDPSRIQRLIASAGEIIRFYGPQHELDLLEAWLCDTCLDLVEHLEGGAGAEGSSPRALALALGAAANATIGLQHTAVDRILDQNPDLDALHWAALERRAALGVADQAAIDRLLAERGSHPGASAKAFIARTALPTPQAKTLALDALLGGQVPVGLDTFGAALWQRRQEDLLPPFARRYLDSLPGAASELGAQTTGRIASFVFPSAGVDDTWLAEVETLAASGEVPLRVATPLRLRADRVRRGLAVRRRQAPA